MNLNKLSVRIIELNKLPLVELLSNSIFYPCSNLDGSVIKNLSSETNSFVYCDYSVGEQNFEKEKYNIKGYKIFANRNLKKEELIPNGWEMKLPKDFNMHKYMSNHSEIAPPFASWTIYERLPEFNDNHGPTRLSLLYIGGEASATYQALYWSNQTRPKIITLINTGTGFGGNYEDFRNSNSLFGWVVLNNPSGMPDLILTNYNDTFNWKGYNFDYMDDKYYGYEGMFTNPGVGHGYFFNRIKS